MNWADWAIVTILGLSAVISLVRGFVREAMSLVIWVAAFAVAMLFYVRLSVFFDNLIATPSLRLLAAWLALFVGMLILGGLINILLGQLVEATGLSGTDRLLGVIFGVARGLILVMVILIFLPQILPVERDAWWQESLLIPHFLELEGWARQTASDVTNFFKRLI